MYCIDWSSITAIGSIVAAIVAAIALILSTGERKRNSKNFENQQLNLKEQFKEQQKYLQKQQFESMFFNMMKQLEDIVSKLSLDDKTGRDIFGYLYFKRIAKISVNYDFVKKCQEQRILHLGPLDQDFKKYGKEREQPVYIVENAPEANYIKSYTGIEGILSYLGLKGYENEDYIHLLDHYFRYLYRIMKFVDEADYLETDKKYIDKRYRYMGILRATLSPYELVFLFYNGLSKKGNNKLKPLLEKYTMLKNLRSKLLAYVPDNEDENKERVKYIAKIGIESNIIFYNKSAHYKKDNKFLKNKE